ncbi:hypothetical protein IEQ34_011581 [Dendrobium chrysotoxum]|uniref:DUF4283 domain-containing protein n=1 Tax=Dendrobium chrysotoxum TaxID=161865 RepID=A0AAV7GRN0_DENCH|nr:hypothetical protein IEQ34_011581 [Dendrobium chrysotoxum]
MEPLAFVCSNRNGVEGVDVSLNANNYLTNLIASPTCTEDVEGVGASDGQGINVSSNLHISSSHSKVPLVDVPISIVSNIDMLAHLASDNVVRQESFLTIHILCYMKILKWSPFFYVNVESPIIPIWISLPNLRPHLFSPCILQGLGSLFGHLYKLIMPPLLVHGPLFPMFWLRLISPKAILIRCTSALKILGTFSMLIWRSSPPFVVFANLWAIPKLITVFCIVA